MLRLSRSSKSLQERVSRVSGQTSSRSITPRSKLALTAGFVIAAAAVMVLGPHAGTVFAESDDSASFWRAEQSRKNAGRQAAAAQRQPAQQQQQQYRQPAAQQQRQVAYQQQRRAAQPQQVHAAAPPRHMTAYAPVHIPASRTNADNPFWFFTQPGGPPAMLGQPHAVDHQPRRAAAPQAPRVRHTNNFSERPRQSTSGMVCVRLCDGFFFPAPAGFGASDAGCAAVCPSAPTRLYSMRSDRIIDAVAMRDGAPYTNLPVALRYTRTRDQTCSCGAPDPRAAIMADSSLRSGDRFMSDAGFLIYQRGGGRKISPRDFTSLAQTRGLPRSERNLLMAMERVSVGRWPERMATVEPHSVSHVALGPPPRPLTLR